MIVPDGAVQLTARAPDVDPFVTVGAPGAAGGVFAKPLIANRNPVLSLVQLPELAWARQRPPFAMLQPVAAPESSSSDPVPPSAPKSFPWLDTSKTTA